VRNVRVEKKINEVVNRLNKTRVDKKPDLRAEREERDRRERESQKARAREDKKKEKEEEDAKRRDAEQRLLSCFFEYVKLNYSSTCILSTIL